MGFNFRKSIKIGPARVNISKSGVGYSVGTKGFRVTKTAKGGTRYSARLLGTGISYSKTAKSKAKRKKSANASTTRTTATKQAAPVAAAAESAPIKKTWAKAVAMAVIGFVAVGVISFVAILILYGIIDLFTAGELPVWANRLILAGIPLVLALLAGYFGFSTMKPEPEDLT